MNNFVSAEQIYSKIKREWKSLVSSNAIDDGEFPVYTMEVLDNLGLSVMEEAEDILLVENGKVKLPAGFKQLHSAWKCDPCHTYKSKEIWHPQQSSTVRYDITCEKLSTCELGCECSEGKLIDKITVQQFIKDECSTWEFNNPQLLRLSPNVKSFCAEGCINLMSTNENEISINKGYIHCNFTDAVIYLKYYAMPTDEDGYPMIPDSFNVKKAVEWWIKYQILLSFWFDSSVTDIMQRWSKAELEYQKYFDDARFDMKLPSFASLMNSSRNKRALNALTFFSQTRN